MATPASKKSHTGKILIVVLLLFVAGLVGMGYYSQTSSLSGNSTQAAETEVAEPIKPLAASDPLFIAAPEDIVIGQPQAPVTIIDYSSLSCPHCAHFHTDILPQLKKELLDTGKAKLVFRHFPLNEPALRGAQVVECAGGEKREKFLNVLFSMQKNWAFNETFKADLKGIAAQGGMDAAAFESCLANKELEDTILQTRQIASTKAAVNSTPSFFVNGVALDDFSTTKAFTDAVAYAGKPVEEKTAAPQAAQPAASEAQ